MGRQDKEQCDFDKNERFSLTEIDKVLIELLLIVLLLMSFENSS